MQFPRALGAAGIGQRLDLLAALGFDHRQAEAQARRVLDSEWEAAVVQMNRRRNH